MAKTLQVAVIMLAGFTDGITRVLGHTERQEQERTVESFEALCKDDDVLWARLIDCETGKDLAAYETGTIH